MIARCPDCGAILDGVRPHDCDYAAYRAALAGIDLPNEVDSWLHWLAGRDSRQPLLSLIRALRQAPDGCAKNSRRAYQILLARLRQTCRAEADRPSGLPARDFANFLVAMIDRALGDDDAAKYGCTEPPEPHDERIA